MSEKMLDMKKVVDMFSKHQFEDNNSIQVNCPVCGYEYVHFEAPKITETDDYKAWSGRGSCIRIPMWCEDNHKWNFCLGFHKGYTYSFLEIVEEKEEPLGNN